MTPSLQRVVAAALEARYKLEVTETHARDSGIQVARSAAESGSEMVIAFGGDGLVNEVVNGMAGSDSLLAVIPGGTMNVFARNLGIPRDPLEAADRVLNMEAHQTRRIVLASANERLFTFACGCGFDAEAAAHVEDHRRTKRRFGEPYFYAAALTVFLRRYFARDPFLLVEGDFGRYDAVMAVGMNQSTYAYLAGRPIALGSEVQPADGLDAFILRKLRYAHLPAYITGALGVGSFGPEAAMKPAGGGFSVSSSSPFAVHVDGEPLDPADFMEMRASAGSVSVL